ncbi:MAG: hypothetical protein K6B65_05860 [Bacilli bacterium]|nr:hypothetical protein [Bacilli bacterium]
MVTYTAPGKSYYGGAEASITNRLSLGHLLYYFNTPYFIDEGVPTEMTATLDASAKTFTL